VNKRIIAISFVLATFVLSASAQIKIGDIKIGVRKPDPNKPTTTSSPTTNVNKTPTGNPVANTTGGGATREEVSAFRNEVNQFVRERMKTTKGGGKGLHMLKNMADQAARNDYTGCGASETNMRLALDDGAAFAEIIKTKYPNIENPTWTKDPESMVGDWRRAVENRNDIMKSCITTRLSVELQSQTSGLEEKLAKFKADPNGGEWAGFVLMLNFDEPAVLHARLAEKYKESFAVVGATMPDESVFAPYDAALKNLVDEAKRQVANYKWHWTGRDAMIEGKARGWLAQKDPKGTVVKIGMLHTDWQIDSVNGSVPKGRYKRGYVMYRKPGLQQCIVNSFSFEQSYLGNGRYSDMAVTSGMGNLLRLQNCT
jgi:hypothetical protein